MEITGPRRIARAKAGRSTQTLEGIWASLQRAPAVAPRKLGMGEREDFWSGWRDRLTALRNVPPVLKIVWESGPTVVTLGLVLRLLTSLLPIGLLWIAK